MKKLFSTMLAATMVAGMAVTAFAAEGYVKDSTKAESAMNERCYTTADFDNNDYGLIGAYKDDGSELKTSAKINGGDKIYYPILISGDEIDDDKYTSEANGKTAMFFATKASEIDDLKASVKDEVGGKYIDDASIVKKDIELKVDEKDGTFSADADEGYTAPSVKGDYTHVADGDFKVNAKTDGTNVWIEYKGVASKKVAKDTSESTDFVIGSGDNQIKVTVADPSTTITADAEVKLGTVAGYVAGSDYGKVYCVEVKMSDYFKNEETEVEFNIQLKNNGRTEFDTDDDSVSAPAFFNGTFDLGSDSEKFDFKKANGTKINGAEATKFKKGDLEIEIGPDTKSLQLDEVVNKDGEDEDVDNIFIESNDEIDCAFTFDVKASGQDDLYLELNQDAVKDLAVSNQKADLTFFNFPGEPEFDFTGTATFAVEDEDEDNYFYEIVDGELREADAKYDEDEGVFKLRTNKLGSYVISDKELDTAAAEEEADDSETKDTEATGGEVAEDAAATTTSNGNKANANTGAADLIGVASALAVVSIAAAGVVALKK